MSNETNDTALGGSFGESNSPLTQTSAEGIAISAAQAEASRVAAAASAVEAGLSEVAAEADKVQTGLDRVQTGADRVAVNSDKVQTGLDKGITNADVITTNADVALTGVDVNLTHTDVVTTNADVITTNTNVVLTNADVILTEADKVQTGLDRIATSSDVTSTNADRLQIGLDKVVVAADKATVVSKVDLISPHFGAIDSVHANISSVNNVSGNISDVIVVSNDTTNIQLIGSDLSNEYNYIEDNGSISDAVSGGVGTSSLLTVSTDMLKGLGTNTTTDSAILNALTNATSASADALQTGLDRVQTGTDSNTATTQAGIATTKAGEAATSASNALASANSSSADATQTALDRLATSADTLSTATDRAAVATLYDTFDDRYLGNKATDPTLDNDGLALLTGAIYFNTTVNHTRFYNGAAWEDPEATSTSAALSASTSAANALTSENNAAATLAAALPKAGGAMTGAITTTSTFDGRYVSVDGTKLDGIEALADVTDTTNVTAAGAAMLTGATFTGAVTATDFIGPLNGPIRFTAKNTSGGTLTVGQVVYISGVSGNTPTVGLADANDSAKMPAYGLVAIQTVANDPVEIITFGALTGVKTDYAGWALGDTLYVSTTAGTLTNVAPSGESSLIQNLGRIRRLHQSAGSITVGGAGRTNATPNLNDGNVFIGNASNQSVPRALVVADTTGLQTALDLKANQATTYTKIETDTALAYFDAGNIVDAIV